MKKILLICYVIAAVATFGREWNTAGNCEGPHLLRPCDGLEKSYLSAMAAIFMPLYWSAVMQESAKSQFSVTLAVSSPSYAVGAGSKAEKCLEAYEKTHDFPIDTAEAIKVCHLHIGVNK